MKRGGYHVVDFKDQNITSSEGITLVGIYEEIEGSYRKAILVSGITLDGVEQRDTFVEPVHANDSYTFAAYGRTFTVHSDGTVTVSTLG